MVIVAGYPDVWNRWAESKVSPCTCKWWTYGRNLSDRIRQVGWVAALPVL